MDIKLVDSTLRVMIIKFVTYNNKLDIIIHSLYEYVQYNPAYKRVTPEVFIKQ